MFSSRHIKRFSLITYAGLILAGCVSQTSVNGSTAGAQSVSAPRQGIAVVGAPGASGAAPAAAPSGPRISNKTVPAGATTSIERVFAANPDCTMRAVTLHITQQPAHGTAIVAQHDDYPNFPANNPRSACNKTKLTATSVDYTPATGFTGTDFVAIEIFTDSGSERDEKIMIDVK